jgi:serine/threonine protein kinase
MSEVYLGIHVHLDRLVAIKVLHGFLLDHENLIERFKREAKAVANLRHPNIDQVYDFDIQDDIIFMVKEYIDGTSLQRELIRLGEEGKRFPIRQIGSIINDVARALDYAHSKGVLHRDVKPSNILIDKEGKAYLTDFGIARILSDHRLTATGTVMGTPAYMSPEQGRGEELTEESDIYSLGIVAFEMLTGQVPYDAKTPVAIVLKQLTEPVPDITTIVDDVPISAQEVVDRALAKSPESRYSSADELVRALRVALEALESTEPIETAPKETESGDVDIKTPTVVLPDETFPGELDKPTEVMPDTEGTTEFDQPTVEMQEVEEPGEFEKPTVPMREFEGQSMFEQSGVLMSDGDEKDQEDEEQEREIESPEEESGLVQIPPETKKRKIPIWGIVGIVLVLITMVTVVLTQVVDFRKPTLELVFDAENTESGLSLTTGDNRDVETVYEDGKWAWRSGNGQRLSHSRDGNIEADNNLWFDIDDSILYQIRLGTEIRITIYYFDLGYDSFGLEYDAYSSRSNVNYVGVDGAKKTNSGKIKKVTLTLDDAYFANRLGNADFTITDNMDGAETIWKVVVAKYPPKSGISEWIENLFQE